MPPPGSYIDITSDPFTRLVTQAEFNVANDIWFRFVAADPTVLGIQTNSGGTFIPRVTFYESDGSTVVRSGVTGTFGQWAPFRTAGTYFIKVVRSVGGASDFDFTSNFETALLDDFTVVPGDVIINDDEDLPGLLVDSDWQIKSFVSTVPGGEMGAILPNGVSIWHDRYLRLDASKPIAILGIHLQPLVSVTAGSVTLFGFPVFATDAEKFWVKDRFDHLYIVETNGTVTDTGYTFDLAPKAMAANPEGTVLYYVDHDEDKIFCLDLTTFTDLPPLYTIPGFTPGSDKVGRTPNTHPGDLFRMTDGSIVTWWFEAGALTYHLIHVSADGDLLHQYDYVDPIQLDHLAQVHGQSDYVLIWLYTTSGFDEGHFGRLDLATGTITHDDTQELFQNGSNMAGGTAMFGISTSCTFVMMQGLVPDDGDVDIAPGTPGPYVWVHFKRRVPA